MEFLQLDFYHLSWFFILYSFIGWCIEVIFCSVDTGKFVNRGFLNGPVCPIYGFGGVILVLLLSPISEGNILVLYVGSVLICSLLELVAGWALKRLFHTSWWDYSDIPFNIGGYICLKFSLLWGIAGVVLMRVGHPLIAGLVDLIPTLFGWILLIFFYLILVVDVVVTTVAVRSLNRDLVELSKLTAEGIHQGSDAVAKGLGNTAIAVADRLEETIDALDLKEKSKSLGDKLTDTREKITNSLEHSALGEYLERLSAKRTPVRDRLMKAFPRMKNTRYTEAFEHLRANFSRRGTKGEKPAQDDASEKDSEQK